MSTQIKINSKRGKYAITLIWIIFALEIIRIMNILLIISVLLAPLMGLLLFFYVHYRFKRGDITLFYRSYFWGVLSVIIPAIIYLILYTQGYTALTILVFS